MRKLHFTLLALVMALTLSACQALQPNAGGNGTLKASGTISARDVKIAPEIGGVVAEVTVEEGQMVQAGDVLFRLDNALLQAQRSQARAGVETARAAQRTAEAGRETAQAQYELALHAARLQEQPIRASAWITSPVKAFALPPWYFAKHEVIAAAQAEADAARKALEAEQASLDKLLAGTASGKVGAAEKRLLEAQAAYLAIQAVLNQANAAQDNAALQESARQLFAAAETELNAAQSDYTRLLSTTTAADMREARARGTVARARYETALDRLNQLLTGDQSWQVSAAEAGVQQARAAVDQAKAAFAQAEAALKTVEVQLDKTVVRAPTAGTITARNLEPGEAVAPGSTVLVIGQLEAVNLTVYVPEDRYGSVQLGQKVNVTVDSFSGQTFAGTVVHIADQAEFTPRNVQTVDGRRSTVYAVKVKLPNPDRKLKPGMPADVIFR